MKASGLVKGCYGEPKSGYSFTKTNGPKGKGGSSKKKSGKKRY